MRYIKKPKLEPNFTILYDKQEKHPWSLPYPMERVHLATGDYTIKGFEDIIAIEKKSGLLELFSDLAVSYRPTFKRFLHKLSRYPIKCIVVQHPLRIQTLRACVHTLNQKSNGKARMTEETIYYWVAEISLKYDIPILFVDTAVLKSTLPRLFETAYRKAQEIRNVKIQS